MEWSLSSGRPGIFAGRPARVGGGKRPTGPGSLGRLLEAYRQWWNPRFTDGDHVGPAPSGGVTKQHQERSRLAR